MFKLIVLDSYTMLLPLAFRFKCSFTLRLFINVKDLICVEKCKNYNSQLISNRSLLCEALNTTDEKAENLLSPDHYVSRNCADICNLSNIHISAIKNAELMFWKFP